LENNSELKNKIEKLTEEKNMNEQKFNEEIYKFKKERTEQSNDLYDKLKKIELLNKLYKEMETQKNIRDDEIIKYKEEEKKSNQIIKDLKNEIKTCNFELNTLRQQVNENIKINIDNYTFKGLILEDSFNEKQLYNKQINIKFSSEDIKIKLKFDDKDLNIDAKDIRFTFYEKTKDKVIIFYEIKEENGKEKNKIKEIEDDIKNDDIKNDEINLINEIQNDKIKINKNVINAMLCKFTEKECDCIFEFKKEMMKNYKENKKKLENKDSGLTGLFSSFFHD
jgi:hypothetical protein